jgi:hypothetical protein
MPKLKITAAIMLALALFWAMGANAQTALNGNVPSGFVQAGYIQAATLNSATTPNSGGTLTMNGTTMIVPANTVVQFPANTLTWAQLFSHLVSTPVYDSLVPVQPTPTIAAGASGLAMADNPAQTLGLSPDLPFNAIVQGNVDVQNKAGRGVGAYIVGLILPINQDVGNGGQGFVNFIDYAKGRLEVGGILSVQGTGTVIEINDPTGRYGFAHSPDPRWSVDPDNPTVSSFNGYPMGIPKVAPPAIDPDRPAFNRPVNPPVGAPGHDPFIQPGAALIAYSMPASRRAGTTTPDPWKQVPFAIGDYVVYTGVLYSNNPNTPLNPALPINQQTYISANTLTAGNVMIYTAPGSARTVGPAYIQIAGRMVIGNGGNAVTVPVNTALGIQGGVIPNIDPKLNIDIRGYCTDSTALVDIFAIDVNPRTGAQRFRLLGTALPDAGVPGVPAPKGTKGFFRFVITKGNFLPDTRAYMALTRHGTVQLGPQVGNIKPSGGLLVGQYQAPMFNFIFPDAPQGFPAIPTNFNAMPFLAQGEGGNPSTGPLVPFPPSVP